MPNQSRPGTTRMWTPRREFALCAFLVAWILVLPFGHVTGLRNTCAVCAIVLAISIYELPQLRQVPAGKWLVPYSIWCVASLIWSADRLVSWSKLQSDLIVPLLGYVASYLYARFANKPFSLVTPLLIALIALAAMSAMNWFKFLPFDQIIPEISVSGVTRPLPIWYPGVGDASMFATLCVGPLLFWCTARRRGAALRGLVVLGLFGVVLEVSGNRSAFAIAPLAGGLFWVVWRMRSIGASRGTVRATNHPSAGSRTIVAIFAIVVAAALLAAGALELASRINMERSGKPVPAWGHAAIQLVRADARPDFWDEYRHLALRNRWVGVGYGRTVPAIVYGLHDDPAFSAQDPAGRTHAHNLFLDTWLQTGYVGLILLLGVLASLLYHGVRNTRSARLEPAIGAAIVTVIATTILHNLTDDFLVYGMADGFWVLLGLMFGRLALNKLTNHPSHSVVTAVAVAS